MDDANDDVCALCEAKAGTNSAAGSAGDGDSLSKKAVVIGYFNARTHLLYKTCRPKFAAEFGGASARVRHVKPLRGACALCAEYVKPALLDIKSGYSDDSAQDLPRRKKLKGRYRGPTPKVKVFISSLFENRKASAAGNLIKRFVYTPPSVHI